MGDLNREMARFYLELPSAELSIRHSPADFAKREQAILIDFLCSVALCHIIAVQNSNGKHQGRTLVNEEMARIIYSANI